MPGVAVGSGAGASVNGKDVEGPLGDVVVLSGTATVMDGGVNVTVGDGELNCGVEIWSTAGAQPDKTISTTASRTRRRFMVYTSGAVLMYGLESEYGKTSVYALP